LWYNQEATTIYSGRGFQQKQNPASKTGQKTSFRTPSPMPEGGENPKTRALMTAGRQKGYGPQYTIHTGLVKARLNSQNNNK